tara:strand:- start:236 stop:622 length:387 start_codon:yes stop_codon:yes gene_type:complete
MVMITVILLSLFKSILDQFKDITPILQFCLVNISGFFLFLISLLYGKKISNARHQWLNNSFLSAGAVLLCYSSTVEVEEEVHSIYLPIFYVTELVIVLMCGNKVKMETSRERYAELTRTNFNRDITTI